MVFVTEVLRLHWATCAVNLQQGRIAELTSTVWFPFHRAMTSGETVETVFDLAAQHLPG
jgi:hypothetical protein